MANASHPHLFTHEWFERHPRLTKNFGRETIALILGTLLAVATLLATSLDWAQKIPLGASQIVDIATRTDHDASAPAAISSDFFDQFIEQKKAAKTDVLPDQF
ncbi:hypothetical protein [Polaromonas sp.]|uniref:hypothetical protein n=1 Tax=Polaromonas sp. TaxID=1869339 RepID=UPI0017B7DF89|nr:hypothetical protein [Polaromonas sp.]NMM04791.1 hypothetical protein [Polaromonas sp.]